MFFRKLLPLCLVVAVGCTCDKGKTPTDPMNPQGQDGTRQLNPLPQAPTLDVPHESMPGAGEDLSVVAARPQGEQQGEVRPTVTFSRPVQGLQEVEDTRAKDAAKPFAKIDPAIEGEWRWLGSASAEFVPKGLVPFSSTFTVTVFKGLTALDGAKLAEDYTFTFTTPRLELQDVSPARGDRWLRPDSTVTLLFNQPVLAADLEKALKFTAGSTAIALKVEKEISIQDERRAQIEEAKKNGRSYEAMDDQERGYRNRQTRYILKPQTALPLDQALTLQFDPSLHGKDGALPMTVPVDVSWRTYGPLKLESARFCEGEWRCPYGPLVINTTNEVELDTLKTRIKVTPAVELLWDSASTSTPHSEWEISNRRPTVTIPGKFKAGTQYKIEIAGGVADIFKQAAAQGLNATLQTNDLSASLITGGSLGVVEKSDAPIVPVEVSNLKTLNVSMWKLTIPELAKVLGSDEDDVKGLGRSADFSEDEKLTYGKNLARVHPLKLEKIFGAGVKTGLALINVNSPDLEYKPPRGYQQVVQVTDLAAHIKIGPKSSLVWVTRLSDGKPVADAEVTIFDSAGTQVWAGKSNADGFADAPGAVAMKLKNPRYQWEVPFSLVVAQKDGDVSATASTWDSGVEPYEFSLSQGWEGERPESASFTFTDRGIYKPGDEVFVKGVVRYRVLGELRAPSEGSSLTVTINDSKGEKVKTETVKVTKYGTFSLKATIGKEAPTGYYSVQTAGKIAGGDLNVSSQFRVEEYRAPQFRVDVESKKKSLIAGDPLEATVFARYLFGGAMNDVQVKWSSQRTSTSFSSESGVGFTFAQETWWWDDHQPHDASGFFASGEGKADTQGALAVKAGNTEAPGEKPYTYTFEAEVTDVNRQSVAGRTEVMVHPANYYVGLRSPAYFLQVGTEYGMEALVLDTEGKRTRGKKVTVTITSRTWKSVKQKDASGGFTTISEPVETEVKKCELESAEGVVPCAFKPANAGFFIVRGVVKDEQGRQHSSSMGVYATGNEWVAWQRNDTDRVELITDKPTYDVGDVAKVLIKSPYPEAKAMFTVEREGVLSRKLVDLKGSVVTIDVPITEEMVPNVFAGVLIMRSRVKEGGIETGDDPGRPNARIGLVKLNVEKKTKRLAVSVKTDKKDYQPRETVNVTLDVKDSAGKPASGEVTLYVVDEAVLRLTSYEVPDPIASIYPERPLSMRLGEPLLHLVRKRSYGEKGEEAGGGGGDGSGGGFRNQFKTTVLFNPTLEVNNGSATTSFSLPDNLTAFRIMAVVITQTDRFGSGETSVQVNKPVMALPAMPRFARVGDAFEAGVVVHAHGIPESEVTVTATIEGAGAQLTGAAEQKVSLKEGSPREVRFSFKAMKPGVTAFRFKVVGGGATDGVEEKLPIELPVETDAVATYGDTTDQRVEGITPPKDVYEDLGGLTVSMSSTSLGGFDRGFQQLIEYPYGCLEQQSSRLVPFIALREIAGQFGVPWPGPDKKKAAANDEMNALINTYLFSTLDVSDKKDPDEVINATVKSILSLQDGDGSFRYWPSSMCSDPWSSTYATMALYRAREVGFTVPADRLARAEKYLGNVVGGNCGGCWNSIYCGDETRVFASYVLARMKKPKPSSYAEFYARRDKLSIFSRALLANAMFVGGGDRKQANALMQEILNNAKESPKGLSIAEVQNETYATLFNSDTRTTGVVLQALTDITPEHPFVGKMAKYLTGVRQGDGQWRTTQEAAWSLIGLTQVLRTKEKDTPDFKASLTMGTAELMGIAFKGRSMKTEVKAIPMKELLAKSGGAEQKLTFKKEGAGVLYYSALLKYAPKEMPTKPLDSGLFVQRWFEPYAGGGQSTKFFAGDLVRIRVRIASNQERHWAAFEVPLPAGLEPVDTSLSTTAKLGRSPGEEQNDVGYENEGGEDGAEGDAEEEEYNPWAYRFWSPFNHVEMRDSRVVIFADHLPPGVHVTSFVARATTPGVFVLKPARGELMYEPEVWGRSEGGTFTVELPTPVTQK
ncbi:MAG: MG2 domain-containing protein [Archangium sp.]|nr:MG2 domain-containing protein [Archangium sp.]MDP3571983.1 MG2 domain-containing protein [Archangium sp.]